MNKAKWLSLVKLLGPIILTVIKPELAPIAGSINDAIGAAEQMKGASGPDKLKHVQAIASSAADAINVAKGKNVVDKTNLNETVQEAVDTVVAAVNIITKPVAAPTELKQP